jgi:hypothetical protein
MNPHQTLEGVRLLIATPAYGGLVSTIYLESLLAAKARLEAQGARVAVYTISNESLITRARNACVARFRAARLDGQPLTHLLFVDGDIGFPPDAIPRLIRFGAPVVAGCYPLKMVDYAAIAEALRARPPLAATPEALESATLHYPLRAAPITEIRDGFVRVEEVGCGFLLLERRVLDELIARYGDELRYLNDVAGYGDPSQTYELLAEELTFYALFETAIDPATHRYLSEDYAFLRRWRELGGEVWMDITLPLAHAGTHVYRGHVGHFLESFGAIDRAK